MKRLISFILIMLFLFTVSIPAFAEPVDWKILSDKTQWYKLNSLRKESLGSLDDSTVTALFALSAIEMYDRHLATADQIVNIFKILDQSSSSQKEYEFGQGTFVVGIDLTPGTYNITCQSTTNDSYSQIFGSLGNSYLGADSEDYSSFIDALNGLGDSVNRVDIRLITKRGYTEKYLELKPGESARIILEDGMKLDISDGTVKLTFIR